MKARIFSTVILLAMAGAVAAQPSFAQDVNTPKKAKQQHVDLKKDFATLGDNGDLEERAKNLSSNQRVEVVQNRIVNRYNRFEIGANYGLMANGDAYVHTQNLGVQLDYHFTPQWSLGGRYYHSYNQLSSEGNNIYANASAFQQGNGGYGGNWVRYDHPIDTELAVVNFYPIYGKLNMFDAGVAHFDVYVLAGAGQVQLLSGSSTAYTGGVGVGVWLSQHLTMRAEVRYQGYNDLVTTDNRQENVVQGQIGLGLLL